MTISLDYKDVAAKLFEQFREDIKYYIFHFEPKDESNVYYGVNSINEYGFEIYLHNCVETFLYLDEEFYQELKAQILWYIEGEIQGP